MYGKRSRTRRRTAGTKSSGDFGQLGQVLGEPRITSNQRWTCSTNSSPRPGRSASYRAAPWKSSSSASGWSLILTTTLAKAALDALFGDFPINRFDGAVSNFASASSDFLNPGCFDVCIDGVVEAANQFLGELRTLVTR